MIISQSELMGGFLDHAFEDSTPGSYVFLICENGSEHRGEISLRRSGFEIRDCIRWLHGSTHKSVVIGRKPVEGTVAQNVLKYGCGGLNIGGCRVGTEEFTINRFDDGMKPFGEGAGHAYTSSQAKGRWPANVMHDGGLDDLFPTTTSGATKREIPEYAGEGNTTFLRGRSNPSNQHGDSGSASRFFETVDDLDGLVIYLRRLVGAPTP